MIIVPLVRFGLRVHRARQSWNEAMKQFRQAAGYAGGEGAGVRNAAAPRARKKKISRDTGEYIAFEEISADQASEERRSEGGRQTIETEEQIIDVSWEDIK